MIEEGRAVCGFDWPARQAFCLNKPCLLYLSSEESMCCYHLLPVCNVRNRDNWHSNVMSKEWLRQSPLHLIIVFVYYSEIPEDLNLGLYFLKFYPNWEVGKCIAFLFLFFINYMLRFAVRYINFIICHSKNSVVFTYKTNVLLECFHDVLRTMKRIPKLQWWSTPLIPELGSRGR